MAATENQAEICLREGRSRRERGQKPDPSDGEASLLPRCNYPRSTNACFAKEVSDGWLDVKIEEGGRQIGQRTTDIQSDSLLMQCPLCHSALLYGSDSDVLGTFFFMRISCFKSPGPATDRLGFLLRMYLVYNDMCADMQLNFLRLRRCRRRTPRTKPRRSAVSEPERPRLRRRRTTVICSMRSRNTCPSLPLSLLRIRSFL